MGDWALKIHMGPLKISSREIYRNKENQLDNKYSVLLHNITKVIVYGRHILNPVLKEHSTFTPVSQRAVPGDYR